MASNILVTGGAGFVGRHLVSRLITEQSKIFILDNFSFASPYQIPEGTEVISGDIRDKKIVREVVNQGDQIVHLSSSQYL